MEFQIAIALLKPVHNCPPAWKNFTLFCIGNVELFHIVQIKKAGSYVILELRHQNTQLRCQGLQLHSSNTLLKILEACKTRKMHQ